MMMSFANFPRPWWGFPPTLVGFSPDPGGVFELLNSSVIFKKIDKVSYFKNFDSEQFCIPKEISMLD